MCHCLKFLLGYPGTLQWMAFRGLPDHSEGAGECRTACPVVQHHPWCPAPPLRRLQSDFHWLMVALPSTRPQASLKTSRIANSDRSNFSHASSAWVGSCDIWLGIQVEARNLDAVATTSLSCSSICALLLWTIAASSCFGGFRQHNLKVQPDVQKLAVSWQPVGSYPGVERPSCAQATISVAAGAAPAGIALDLRAARVARRLRMVQTGSRIPHCPWQVFKDITGQVMRFQ